MPSTTAPTVATVQVPAPQVAAQPAPTVTISDGLIIAATLIGPILAVQAQKWLEVMREKRHRKQYVFHQLMATRAARLSPEHVQALNMIDLTFYNGRRFGRIRTAKEQAVIDAWKEYLDHLSQDHGDRWEAAISKRDELFINLLHVIAADVGYEFNRVELAKGAYSPQAHGDLEKEQQQVRKLILGLLSGDSSINMNVVGFPVDEAAMKAQTEMFQAQLDAFTGKAPLSVRIETDKPAEQKTEAEGA